MSADTQSSAAPSSASSEHLQGGRLSPCSRLGMGQLFNAQMGCRV